MLLQIPEVLTPGELGTLRSELAHASFEDGAATAGFVARGVKRNLQVPQDSEAGRTCGAIVLAALRRSQMFYSAALPHRVHGPLFNRYDPGMTYGQHVDNAVMLGQPPVRTDLAATLFLSAPEDYSGGELVVHDTFGAHKVKLPAGSMILYAANSAHRVEPVAGGRRLAAVLWIQSMVRDQANRVSLFELDMSLGALRQKVPADTPELASLTALYHNLLRLWAET
jgi:PKHD-type hydroxylase